MICPNCHTDTLLPMDQEGVTLDFCSGCKGVWFDEGEAAFYVETTQDVPGLGDVRAAGQSVDKQCPRCAVNMVQVRYVPDADLMLDICPDCRGVFLDGGELRQLEKLATRLQAGGKVERTMVALEKMGFMVLGAAGRVKR